MISSRFGLVFVLSLATEAAASPLRIEWHAPDECPQGVDVREGVERLLGTKLETADLSASEFSGTVKFVEGVWRLDLSMVNGEETSSRSLTGRNCHEVTEAGIVVLALALNPEMQVDRGPDAEAVEPEPESRPEPEPAEPPNPPPTGLSEPGPTSPALPEDAGPAAPPPERADRHYWGIRLVAVLDGQTLPAPAPGAELGLTFPLKRWTVETHGLYLSRQRQEVGVDRSAEIGLYAGGVGLCYQFFVALDASGCVRAEAGSLVGRGLVANGISGSGRWLAGSAGVLGAWPASGWLAMVAGADAWVPLLRAEFVLGNDLVHRVPAYALRGFFGAEVRFR